MEYLEIKNFLNKNNINHDDMNVIIRDVRGKNKKLDKILKDTGYRWSNLNIHLLQSAVDIYNENN